MGSDFELYERKRLRIKGLALSDLTHKADVRIGSFNQNIFVLDKPHQ